MNVQQRAPAGGMVGYDGHVYRGGEFVPFYVPRLRMPQIDQADYPEFLEFCRSKRIGVDTLYASPQLIYPHQRVDHDKLRHMDEDALKKPILISREPFILDGHHRWARHRELDMVIQAYSLHLNFDAAIALLFEFPKTYSYGDGDEHPVSY